jgi:rod shape determining protein RodA
MMKIDRALLVNFDWIPLVLVLVINVIGILNNYSSCFSNPLICQTPLYIKQIQWFIIGFFALLAAFFTDYRFLVRHAYMIYGISLLLLVIVLTHGYATRGSQRWLAIGSFTFQPSEIVKLSIILALAKYFDSHQMNRAFRLNDLLIPFLIVLIPFTMILKQPDLGTALIILIIFSAIVLFVGVEYKSLVAAVVMGLLFIPAGWHFLKDYQKERILTFFNPEHDPLGTGYHIIQSMIAVGSGGFLGKGYLKGSQTQLKFLPEQQTDFAFSVFAEEWGFIGVIVLLFLFFYLIIWGLKIMMRAKDYSGALLSFGIAMLILWEVFINIGMVIGVLPVVGIPLPFISYGGSSLVVLMSAVGVLMSIGVRRFILQS